MRPIVLFFLDFQKIKMLSPLMFSQNCFFDLIFCTLAGVLFLYCNHVHQIHILPNYNQNLVKNEGNVLKISWYLHVTFHYLSVTSICQFWTISNIVVFLKADKKLFKFNLYYVSSFLFSYFTHLLWKQY